MRYLCSQQEKVKIVEVAKTEVPPIGLMVMSETADKGRFLAEVRSIQLKQKMFLGREPGRIR